MFNLTDNAKKELVAFFETHADAPKSVRVYFTPGGCCGPSANMAIDAADENDVSEVIDGIVFCMAKRLYEMVGEVSIDLGYMGFAITTQMPFQAPEGSGGSCSCSGGCSGCGGGCH